MTTLDLPVTLWHVACGALDLPGGLGLAFGFASGLMPNRRAILLTAACSGGCFSLHFLGLGSTTAMAMSLIGLAQNLLAARYGDPATRPRWVTSAFMCALAIVAAVTLATWHGFPSLLAGFGATLSTFARLQPREQRMRALFLCSSSCWVLHNALVGSVCGMACDALTMSGFAIAALRSGAGTPAKAGPASPARGRWGIGRGSLALPRMWSRAADARLDGAVPGR